MRTTGLLRWLMAGLAVALGVVLLVNGQTVVGALVVALAGVRLVLLLSRRRRRAAWRARRAARLGGRGARWRRPEDRGAA